MAKYSKLRRNLLDLTALNSALSFDTRLALLRVSQSYREQMEADETTDHFEVSYWHRVFVRCFFAHMEGLSYFMRRTAGQAGNSKRLGITTKQRADLLERRYDRDRDRVTDILDTNTVPENLKLAFRYYPRLFDINFTLNTNSPSWNALVAIEPNSGVATKPGNRGLVGARNRMTHTGRFEDFYSIEAAQTLTPCLVWFLRSTAEMLRECYQQVGVDPPELDDHPTEGLEFNASAFKEFSTTREEMDRETVKWQSRSFLAFQTAIRLLWRELNRAIEDTNLLLKHRGLDDPTTQFAVKNSYRIIIVYAEGSADLLRRYLAQAQERNEITLTEAEERSLESGQFFDRIVATYTVFSAKFGQEKAFSADPNHWQAVRTVLGYRNRLTHPLRVRDLTFNRPSTFRVIANSLGWLVDTLQVIHLDADLIGDQGRRSGSSITSKE